MIKDKTGSRIFTFLLITFPIFRIYSSPIPGINYAELIMLTYIFIVFFTKGTSFRFKKKSIEMKLLYLYIFYFAITLLANYYIEYFSIYDSLVRLLRWGFYIFLLVISRYFLDKQYALKFIKFTVIFTCLLLWIQIFSYYILGKVLTFKIPGLPIAATAYDTGRLELYYERNIFRPYSLFLEPAHFSYFAIVGLCVVLFINTNKKLKKDYFVAIFITISLIASTSSSALFLAIVVWLYYFYLYMKLDKSYTKIFYSILITFLILGIGALMFKTDTVQFAINKVFTGENFGGSRMNSYKVFFENLSDFDKAIGIGIGNEEYFFKANYGMDFGYSNTIGYLIVGTGIIGLTLFFAFLVDLWLRTHRDLRAFVIVFILTIFYSPMLFSINLILILLWPCFFINERGILGVSKISN